MTDTKIEIPEEFSKVIRDFVNDMKVTFPEYTPIINKWWKDANNFVHIKDDEERKKALEQSESATNKFLFNFCKKKYPPRFFEILYQNEEIFIGDRAIKASESEPKLWLYYKPVGLISNSTITPLVCSISNVDGVAETKIV